jgi:membrane protein DedA with SNARE-associated domain
MAVLGTASFVGVAFSLYLVETAPLLLIGLSPLARHFVLVAPSVDPLAYLAVGISRRLAFFTACYFLGRALGPVGLVWLEARARRFAGVVRWLERLFQRGGHVLVLLMVGPTTATLAGIAGMRLLPFLLLASFSLFYRLVLVYQFADFFREPIEDFLVWLEDYQLPGTLVLIAGIAAWRLLRRRAARPR